MLKPHFIELNHLKSTIFCGLNPPVKSLNEVRPLAVNLGPGWGEIYGILRKNPGEKNGTPGKWGKYLWFFNGKHSEDINLYVWNMEKSISFFMRILKWSDDLC